MSRDYVPAAGFRAFTRLYDPIMALTMREGVWRSLVADRLASRTGPDSTIVDVGAGTGTLALQVADRIPGVNLVAVDGDPAALDIGRGKDPESTIEWVEGQAEALPAEDRSADACVISLVLHHLKPATKAQALAEAKRVLKPGGKLIVADWGRPELVAAPGFLALRCLDGFPNTADHARGRLPTLIERGGFRDVRRFGRLNTIWGTIDLIEAAA
ncbi:MAG: methyltransferase domain-containing protein [Solirubrobacterales bacterium]|nr:methyltransferase domain-containing protein [Solirubrobacterales bacterium]